MDDYKIELGVKLNTTDLAEQIGKLDNKHKIKVGVDLGVEDIRKRISAYNENTNNAKLKLKIKLDTSDLKKQIGDIDLSAKGKGLAVPVDTKSLENSLKEVSTIIKDIRNSLGTIDDKSDMKSLVASINQIASALERATNESDGLVASLNALSKKDFSVNFGLNMGSSNPIGRNVAYGNKVRNETLPQLKKQVESLVKYYNEAYKTSLNEFTALSKLASKANLGDGNFFNTFLYGDNSVAARMSSGSLASQMQAYKEYIDMFKKAASLSGLDLTSVTSQFYKTTDALIKDAQDIQTGANEMQNGFEKIKSLFSGGIDSEGLSASLEPIITNLNEIKEAIQELSKVKPFDGLTASFDRLSGSIENLLANAEKVRGVLGSGLGESNVGNAIPQTNNVERVTDKNTAVVIQGEKKKQEAYKATADAVLYHAGVISKLNKAETNGRFYGSNRGTGYFGTGHYFVDSATKHELDNDGHYSKLPYTSVDISQYDNLFKVTSDEIGDALHSFLGNLTRFTQGDDAYDIDELFAQFKNVFGDTIMDIKEFGSRLDQLKTFMSNSSLDDRSDSVSTQFMKSLGYGGVDTRGTKLADTRYGTVIYDLKEESILQANITDELQKQGQMLEKINYEKGQVFDKSEDDRIQGIIDAQKKKQEISDEFKNTFDTTSLDKANNDLLEAKNHLAEIDEKISSVSHSLNNLDQEYEEFSRELSSLGLGDDLDDLLLLGDEDEWKQDRSNEYKNYIDELSREKAELQSKISALEEVYGRESRIANEAYERAKQTVEQRHLESQSIKQVSDVGNLDDVIDRQVLALMDKFDIAGDKGSKAFAEIKQAVIECRAELTKIKNSDIGIDEEVFDTSRAVDKVTNAIANQYRAVNNLGDEYVKLAEKIEETNKREKGYKIQIPEFVKQEQGDDYRANRGSLGAAFTTGKGTSFADFIDQINNELGQTIDLTKGEAEAFDELLRKVEIGKQQKKALEQSDKYRTSTASTEEILEQNGINREEISNDARAIVNIIDEAEQQIAQSSIQTTTDVSQDEEKKRQEYRETAKVYEKVSRDTSLVRDDVSFRERFEATNQAAQEAQKHFQELLADEKAVVSITEQFDNRNVLQSFAVNVKRASGEVETLRYAMKNLADKEAGEEDYFVFDYQGASSSDKGVKRQLESHIKKANDLQIQLDKIKSRYSDMGHAKPIKDADHIESLNAQYKKVEAAIESVRNADNATYSSMLSNAERERTALENMEREFRNAENVSSSLKGTDLTSGIEIAKNNLEKFKAQAKDFPQITQTVNDLDEAITSVGDKSSLDSFTDQLKVARAELAKVKAETIAANRKEKVGIVVSGATSRIADIQRISPEINEFKTVIDGAEVSVESLLKDLSEVNTAGDFSVVNSKLRAFEDAAKAAGIAVTETVTKASSITKIKDKLQDTGFNGFEQEVARAHAEAKKLEGVYDDLENALRELDVAMTNVSSADQTNDTKRLVAANEEYENSLKRVYSQLKLYQQAEKQAFDAEMLKQKKESLNSEMEVWLKENSRAAKDFGAEIRNLQGSLDSLDDRGVKLVGQQFKTLTKQAQAMGKTGLTVFDKLKLKVKEYMAYLSAAEMFMYAEQALRSMFEQVKLIDAAMTELKKVTNETDEAYDNFLSNAADRAREIGTTIDGLVKSTADFARLGYGFEDAQGLAEVANIYAVVGDEIEGVEGATESLISTMAAFKDEMNGMSNTDFAMSLIDKFNEIGKLIA